MREIKLSGSTAFIIMSCCLMLVVSLIWNIQEQKRLTRDLNTAAHMNKMLRDEIKHLKAQATTNPLGETR